MITRDPANLNMGNSYSKFLFPIPPLYVYFVKKKKKRFFVKEASERVQYQHLPHKGELGNDGILGGKVWGKNWDFIT